MPDATPGSGPLAAGPDEGTPGPSVLIVQNGPQGGPRRFGQWLVESGLSLEVVHGYDGDPVPEEPGEHGAVVVLGGGYMPDDDDRAPWLKPTRALVRAALDQRVPVFGICLGGQLLAQVGGGAVAAESGVPETGTVPVTLRPEAADDLLFHGLPQTVPAIERHVDVITELPPGARWLARSENCPYQAFRLGERAWGTQFHPEVSADQLDSWDPEPLRRRGLDPVALRRAAQAAEPAAEPVWHTVTTRFAELVHQAASER